MVLASIFSACDVLKVDLNDDAVLVLAVLWENKDAGSRLINKKKGFGLVNERLKAYNKVALSCKEYDELLKKLEDIGCVALKNETVYL